MQITVRLAEPFWRSVGQRNLELELAEGSSVADLLTILHQRYPALVKEFTETPPHVFFGEREVVPETPLTDGGRVHLVWPIAGGYTQND
jgi:sulfur carrier protein ThiS